MDLASELVRDVEQSAPDAAVRRIAGIALPPGRADDRTSPFTIVQLDNGDAGASYNIFTGNDGRAAYDGLAPESFTGMNALALAREFASTAADHLRIIGFAALNALSQAALRSRQAELDFGADVLAVLAPAPGELVVMVGLFKSVPGEILARGARLTVIERDRELLSRREQFQITADISPLSVADKVLITSSCLLNGQMEEYLAAAGSAKTVVIAGPGASLLPGPFFRRGVAAVGGTLVTDGVRLADRQRQGAKWGDAAQKYMINRQNWRTE